MLVGKPTASFKEGSPKHLLCKADRIAPFPAAPAFELIIFEGQAGMVVVVEGAEAFVPADAESESLRDPLNRKVAKLLKLKLIHNQTLSLTLPL